MAEIRLINFYNLNSAGCQFHLVHLSEQVLLHLCRLLAAGLDLRFFVGDDLQCLNATLFNLVVCNHDLNQYLKTAFCEALTYIERCYLHAPAFLPAKELAFERLRIEVKSPMDIERGVSNTSSGPQLKNTTA